jgi:hypothetical protein
MSYGVVPFGGAPYGSFGTSNTVTLIDSLGAGLTGSARQTAVMIEAIALALAGSGRQTAVLRAMLGLDASGATSFDGTRTLSDSLELGDRLVALFHALLADTMELDASGNITYRAITRLADRMLLEGTVPTAAEAHAVLLEALTLGVLGGGFPMAVMTDGLGLEDSIAAAYTAVAKLVDSLALEATQSDTATAAVALRDDMAIAADGTVTLDAVAVLRDQLDFVLRFTINDEQFIAWSINTSSRAASTYDNYNFNSFMRIGKRYYGVSATGRYRLEGPNDAGMPIQTRLRFGLSTMGSRVQKRTPEMFFAWRGGDLLIKVVTASSVDGAREAHVYRLYSGTNGASLRPGRVKTGKRIKAAYFDYVVENIDGAAFELDTLEWIVLDLDHRLQGNAGGKP